VDYTTPPENPTTATPLKEHSRRTQVDSARAIRCCFA
jgi:hypothetical protein